MGEFCRLYAEAGKLESVGRFTLVSAGNVLVVYEKREERPDGTNDLGER